MLWIRVTTSPIFWVPAARPSTTALVRRASSAAFPVTAAERVACCAISRIEAVSSSAAEATVPTLSEAWVDAGGGCRGLSGSFPAAVADRRGHALHLAGGHGDGFDDMADLTLELGGEPAYGCIAFQPGLLLGLAALGGGPGLGGGRGFDFGGLLRCRHEQLFQLIGHPGQHAGFQDEDARMQHHAAKVGTAREDRRWNDEIQRQMMQRDGNGSGEDRPDVAIGDETRQRCEEVHVHVDLPGMACQFVGEHRNPPISATPTTRLVESPLPAARHDKVAAAAKAVVRMVGISQAPRAMPTAIAIGTCSQSSAIIALLAVSRNASRSLLPITLLPDIHVQISLGKVLKQAAMACGSSVSQAPAWRKRRRPS